MEKGRIASQVSRSPLGTRRELKSAILLVLDHRKSVWRNFCFKDLLEGIVCPRLFQRKLQTYGFILEDFVCFRSHPVIKDDMS